MAKFLVFYTNGEVKIENINDERALSEIIHNGYLESIPFGKSLTDRRDMFLFCDEDGKSKNLLINHRATAMFQIYHPIGLWNNDCLAGNIVITGTESKDFFKDVPEWFVEKVNKIFAVTKER